MKHKMLSDKKLLHRFIELNIPLCVKPKRKSKTVLVAAFTSRNAIDKVIEHLSDELFNELNKTNDIKANNQKGN
jgi:endonuclease III